MQTQNQLRYLTPEEKLVKVTTRIILTIVLLVLVLGVWAKFATLDEVVTGQGTVVTWSRGQVIQNRDGGVISQLYVREGDRVAKGQLLAMLDQTRFRASYDEIDARVRALAVSVARLQAEVTDVTAKPDFLSSLKKYAYSFAPQSTPESDKTLLADNEALIKHELALLTARRRSFNENISGLTSSLRLATQEMAMTKPLVKRGAVSQVEELRLQREETNLKNKIIEARNHYFEQAREEMVKNKNELDSLYYQLMQREDQVASTKILSPVDGVVKDVRITTVGGVLEAGGKLMEVVPSNDQLLIEIKVNPRDIAFIRPDQKAIVKISAYDPSIYGTMDAVVERISPDTLQDEVKREQYYYQVYVRTMQSWLLTADNVKHEIVPGMPAIVDIKTGEKTVLDYILKPLNKAKEALRER
ncbi:HlyD family efflux transporter periplasmic adaptor subunit [Enterobacteriaceae bacterium C34A]|uniref:HlyD family efflux transporter periplasmic adaptor subunit n=1 Tax=Enterobacter sp. CC120223-11 TaxID=1378073 RepID=UPI000BCA3AFB|nr:HlyD family efflux transporter periplasmic adaptor subunit [Enterobacter sp. CC120223-11]SNY65384.1 membrane fusion protein, adhesin transport system [Enterobacter sp. CC120223-11]